MVERGHTKNMSGKEVTVLKETLLEQQTLLQKLQQELEAERESAATSASEAVSMILRLQGEKAELKLEASQYKRMAEEEMCHAETSLEILEDLIYQKEIEISFLEHHVQAYRFKLLSLGFADIDISGNFDVIPQTNDQFDCSNEIRNVFECEDRSQTPSPVSLSDSCPVEKGVIEQKLDLSRKGSECCDSSRANLDEQIKNLDKRVKQITEFGNSESRAFLSYQESEKPVAETNEYYASSSKVQDIFEVPQTNKKVKGKEEGESPKKTRKNSKIARKLRRASSNKKSRAWDSVTSNDPQAEMQQLRARMERLEGERIASKMEITPENREEELSMLREIKEQLNCVQSEMRSLRTPKKSPCPDDSALLSVKEAMLYFWM